MKRLAVGILTLITTPSLPWAFPPQADSGRLGEAAELLAEGGEDEVRRGAEICASLDSPAAVELLLEVLNLDEVDNTARTRGLPEGHYRDVVWDSLLEIRDPYARMRVEKELAENKKNADVRFWCAELLGEYGEGDFGATLMDALSDDDLRVAAAAARSLGILGHAEAAKKLLRLTKNKDVYLRTDALIALAQLDPEAQHERYATALSKDKDAGARCALLAEAPTLYPDEAELYAAAALEDKDWRPRKQAVENLGTTKTKTSVDRLILATRDERPVVAEAALNGLTQLTGQKHTKTEAWQAWWGDQRETFDFPEGVGEARSDSERSIATYHGIQLLSDHVAFLIDKSHAMGEVSSSRGVSRDAAAHDELAQVLESLNKELSFNVFTYERSVETFEKKPTALKKSSRKKALAFVDEQRCQGRKDIWQVLDLVVRDPGLDSAYLLSSGEPDTGLYVHWNRITRHLKQLNRFHKVVVHAIAFTDNEWHQDQLEKISEVTGGEFRVVE